MVELRKSEIELGCIYIPEFWRRSGVLEPVLCTSLPSESSHREVKSMGFSVVPLTSIVPEMLSGKFPNFHTEPASAMRVAVDGTESVLLMMYGNSVFLEKVEEMLDDIRSPEGRRMPLYAPLFVPVLFWILPSDRRLPLKEKAPPVLLVNELFEIVALVVSNDIPM